MARRRSAVVLALVALAWTGLSPAAAAAAAQDERSGSRSRGGEVLKAGWWWAANQPPAETGVVAHPQQSPPNVPAGHLPVAASAGEPEKVTAVELRLDAEPGALVGAAEVVLQESTAPGANVNAEAAKLVACPVTDGFWADGTAARWDARPAYDCETAQAAGVRDDQGRWTFDLTGIASSWLAAGATGSPSFAVVEAVDAPESFQVTFAPVAEDGVVYRGTYLPAARTSPAGSGAGALAAGGAAPGGPAATGGTGSLSSGSLDAGAPLDPPPVDGGTAETTEPVQAATTPVASPMAAQPWYSGLPAATFLLAPFALALAYLAMLALGPDAQPAAGTSRHGVSRALERLRQAGVQAVAGARR